MVNTLVGLKYHQGYCYEHQEKTHLQIHNAHWFRAITPSTVSLPIISSFLNRPFGTLSARHDSLSIAFRAIDMRTSGNQ